MSQRVRIIKDFDKYNAGDVKVVENNIAHDLIEGGVAILSKDMVNSDIKTKTGVKRAYKRNNK